MNRQDTQPHMIRSGNGHAMNRHDTQPHMVGVRTVTR